ncbi:hypothetical protein [Bordetella genomosp. 4]|uniref:hypothetical protein n=1 Tax=Bordetella genomosp. 4 TaxID=463044 RepID=UPI000B9DD9CF|nr:hypothetical protein [Bordetella genomosp. 4]OZI41928.1 hypothetical protein CAL21_24580 [Bordetella genomosp. 4]
MKSSRATVPALRTTLALIALTALLAGCAPLNDPGPPHPGAVNPYSNGGFHDAGPNYPNTGI